MPRAALLDRLVWIFIYGGLILIGLGLSVQRLDATLGWVILVVGIAAAVAGAVLVVVRSRIKENAEP